MARAGIEPATPRFSVVSFADVHANPDPGLVWRDVAEYRAGVKAGASSVVGGSRPKAEATAASPCEGDAVAAACTLAFTGTNVPAAPSPLAVARLVPPVKRFALPL